MAALDSILTAKMEELDQIVSKVIIINMEIFKFLLLQKHFKECIMARDGVDPEDSPWEQDEREEFFRYKVRVQRKAEELVGGSPFPKPSWISPVLVPPYRDENFDRQLEVRNKCFYLL